MKIKSEDLDIVTAGLLALGYIIGKSDLGLKEWVALPLAKALQAHGAETHYIDAIIAAQAVQETQGDEK